MGRLQALGTRAAMVTPFTAIHRAPAACCPQGPSVPYTHFLVFTENKGSWQGNLSKLTLN